MQTHLPIGYQIIYGKVEIDSDKSQTVKLIFTDYSRGKTLSQIAKHLTQNDVPNANDKTNWTHGAVCRILENYKYLGDDFFPRIISNTLFEKVQEIRQSKTKRISKAKAEISVKIYPRKPIKIYIPQEVRKLDEQINSAPNDIDLIFKRAEIFYKSTKIYDINEGVK